MNEYMISETEDFEAGQMPPESENGEIALLGAILTRPERFRDVVPLLEVEDLFYLDHQYIFEAMLAIHARKENPEFLLVVEELKSRDRLQDVGGHQATSFYGSSYLMHLMTQRESYGDPAIYARVILRASVRRQVVAFGRSLDWKARDHDKDVLEVLADADEAFGQIKQRVHRRQSGGLQPAGDIIDKADPDAIDEAYEAYKQRTARRFKTGWVDLDKFLLADGSKYITIGARPRVGKSSALAGIVYNSHIGPWVRLTAAEGRTSIKLPDGKFLIDPTPEEVARLPRIAFFSLEMSAEEVMNRWVAMVTGISAFRIERGDDITLEEFRVIEQVKAFIDLLDTRLLLHCGGITVEQWMADCRAWSPDVIFTDYAQKFSTTQKFNGQVEKINIVSGAHKDLALELNVPIFAGAQVSRGGEYVDRPPTLEDLKGSGSLEEDSDTVIFIHRPDLKDARERANEADLIIAKQRNGPTGTATLYFDRERTMFRNGVKKTVHLNPEPATATVEPPPSFAAKSDPGERPLNLDLI